MRVSKLRVVSIGRVVEDGNRTGGKIKVLPIELMPGYNGPLTVQEGELTDEGIDGAENRYSVKVKCANYLNAEWLSIDTNRKTPPDVMENEQVLVWQYSDADTYYWTSMGRDDDLRRLETIVWAISDLPEKSDETLDGDNTYFIEFSTHKKSVTLSTAARNGEKCRYHIQANPGEGFLTMQDDIGNLIKMDSVNATITARNVNTSEVQLKRGSISITAPENITVTAGDNITVTAGNNISVKAGNNLTMQAGNNVGIQAGVNYSMNAGASASLRSGNSLSLSSSVISISAPIIGFSGKVSVGGWGRDKESRSGYTATFNTDVIFQRPVTFNQTVTVNASSSFNGQVAVNASATFLAPVTFAMPVTGTIFTGISFNGAHIGPCAGH